MMICHRNTASKANRTLGFLRRNMKDCTKPVKDLTYKSMIRPTMEYSSTICDPYLQTHHSIGAGAETSSSLCLSGLPV